MSIVTHLLHPGGGTAHSKPANFRGAYIIPMRGHSEFITLKVSGGGQQVIFLDAHPPGNSAAR